MPAKYSHVKKRTAKKGANGTSHRKRTADPGADKGLSNARSQVAELERAISRLLLLRYEQDIARLYSTRLYNISVLHLPNFVIRCSNLAGPGWVAYNAECDEVKDFFRAVVAMELRQAGERVATKSVLWSYTALRHFAMSNNVPICQKKGLHSIRLLPHFEALKGHVDMLDTMPPPTFNKPPHLGSLEEGHQAIEDAFIIKYTPTSERTNVPPEWAGDDWQPKVRLGYDKLTQCLWRVAKEFDVGGYGKILREKLNKWCDCGCSTDHLGEVCEKTVREEEDERGVRLGKQREFDGRGSGVFGWETEDEEDIWDVDLAYGGLDPTGEGHPLGEDAGDMTMSEFMDWRFLKAEREKEDGNIAFRQGDFQLAIEFYEKAYKIEPELPHYQLNIAAAHLKLMNWIEADTACTKSLSQHHTGKGYFRRAKARKALGKTDAAIKDLRAALKLQPTNLEALTELATLVPPSEQQRRHHPESIQMSSSSSASATESDLYERLGVAKPKPPNKKRPIPFARTRADDLKLRILLANFGSACDGRKGPGSEAADLADFAMDFKSLLSELPPQNGLGGAGGAGGGGTGGKYTFTKDRNGQFKPDVPGKKSLTKVMEMDLLKSKHVLYPSWERYHVKRAD